jgi:hypothetical protein
MVVDTAVKSGLYLYAIVPSSEAPLRHPHGFDGTLGVNGSAVTWICEGPLAAAVSEVPNGKIRPERRNLAAHQGVLKFLMQEGTVLPVTFGVIADSPESTRKILSGNHDTLVAQLEHVAGKVEMGVGISWNVPNIFEYFVNTHAALSQLRDQLFRGGRTPSREEMIELGRTFDHVLGEDRTAHTKTIVQILASRCFEIKENPPRGEREISNLACLVGRDAQAAFEQGIMEAARLFDNCFSFDYNGPWPPYNFVDVNLQM